MFKILGARLAVAAGLSLSLVACVPEFEQALDTGAAADPAIIGLWDAKAQGDGPDDTMRIEIAAADGALTLAFKDTGSEQSLKFKGRSAEVNGVKYISLTPDDPEAMGAGDAKVGYMIFRYIPDGAGFKVAALDPDKVAEAIDVGKLKGTNTGPSGEHQSKITSSASDVAAWLATTDGQAAFQDDEPSDVLLMTRVTP